MQHNQSTKHFRRCAFATLLVLALAVFPGMAQPDTDHPTYKTGYTDIMKLGSDIHESLDRPYRDVIHSQPIFLETDVTPFVRTIEYPEDPKPLRAVFVSAGFIDLVNNVAHAKAIDQIEPGYLQKYILSLSQETGEMSLQDLPNLSDKRFWVDDIIEAEQPSNFNQIVGTVVATKLAHHYLGHYKKYESQLNDANGNPVAIYNLLTPAEWEAALKAGARNALNAGLAMDGVKALYDAIDKMPKRPPWTAYFLPDHVKVSKLKKDLEKIESDYFKGR
jgi:hypothetical protein